MTNNAQEHINQITKKEKIKQQYPSLAKEIDYHLIKGECGFSQSIICEQEDFK